VVVSIPTAFGVQREKKNTNNQREKKRRAGEVGERIWGSNFHDIKYCNTVKKKKKKKKKKRNDKARRSKKKGSARQTQC